MKEYPSDREEWKEMPVRITKSELEVGNWQVMQKWEKPLMDVLAREVTRNGGDVLEIGFGMGIAASKILEYGCDSYSVIEAHPDVADIARKWSDDRETPIHIYEGFWQDIVPELDQTFDGILFDTFPLSEEERHRNHFPFIPVARQVLKPDGVLTYYSDETVDFRKEHLDLLLENYDHVELLTVDGLEPPEDCEYWSNDHMVVPVARR